MIDIYDLKPNAIIWEMNYRGIPLVEAILESDSGLLDSAFSEPDEVSSDELLREEGFYDSSDPRSCINRKRF